MSRAAWLGRVFRGRGGVTHLEAVIVAFVKDPVLGTAVTVAARWDEDVVTSPDCALRLLDDACVRTVITDAVTEIPVRVVSAAVRSEVPIVEIDEARIRAWEAERRTRVPPEGRAAFYAARLRALIPPAPPTWVDRVLADLARAAGLPLPRAFRAVARRVMEDPVRYTSVETLGSLTGIGSGALKARFRRRQVPSPHECLRWLRLLGVMRRLRNRTEPVSRLALGMGFTSSGNLARFTRSLCGRSPSQLRSDEAVGAVVVECAQAILQPRHVEGWGRLERTFKVSA